MTYGFFVAMAFLSAAIVLRSQLKMKFKQGLLKPLKQKEKIGEPASPLDLLAAAVLGFIIGYKLFDVFLRYSDFVRNPQEFLSSTDGNFMGGIVAALAFGAYRFYEKHKKRKAKPYIEEKTILPHELTGNILLVAALSGIIGAKLFHLLENVNDLIADPIGMLFSFSGLTFFGGLLVGSVTVMIYARQYKIGTLHLADSGAPAIALGYGVGRIGCQMSGDGCWGIANTAPKPEWLSFLPDWMWSFDFPGNVIKSGVPIENCNGAHCYHLAEAVFPTSFYETCMMFAIFGILMLLRNRFKISGTLFAFFLILVGIERFFIEKIRINNKYMIFDYEITQAEIISVVLILVGILGIFMLKYGTKKDKLRIESEEL